MERLKTLPPLLECQDGSSVTASTQWSTKRRDELLELLSANIYGKVPPMDDTSVSWRVADERCDEHTMACQAKRKTVEITVTRKSISHSFPFVLFSPAGATESVPCFLFLCNRGIKDADPARHFLSPFWPAEMIVSQGYATGVIFTHDIAPDYDEGFTMGLHKLFGEYTGSGRPADLWGTIATWGWAASRVLDYLETDTDIDATKVAVVGHSRGGKTALWASAQDTRFALTVSSCAGNSGDALARKSRGETIGDITTRFPYWFAKNYQQYADNEEAMPFDQHMLLALIAPRLLYTTAKTFDGWADPAGQFISLVAASPAWELYGEVGIQQEELPKPEEVLHAGKIGHHYKSGYHTLDEYDWNQILLFADRHLR